MIPILHHAALLIYLNTYAFYKAFNSPHRDLLTYVLAILSSFYPIHHKELTRPTLLVPELLM